MLPSSSIPKARGAAFQQTSKREIDMLKRTGDYAGRKSAGRKLFEDSALKSDRIGGQDTAIGRLASWR